MRYWIVKGNPRENDLDDILVSGVVDRWRTARPPRKWNRGDRLFFWSSAPRLELVGLGELLGPTGELTDFGETIYEVHYLTNPLAGRVKAAELRANPICQTANFLKPAVAQGVLEVAPEQAFEMYRLLSRANDGRLTLWKDIRDRHPSPWGDSGASLEAELGAAGQGFGEPESNREVERAAVRAVTDDYRRRGWTVRSVERDKVGYDLECRRGHNIECVEVKGIAGSQCTFLITAGELACAARLKRFVLVAVTDALERPRMHRILPRELRTRFRLDPIAYKATPLPHGSPSPR